MNIGMKKSSLIGQIILTIFFIILSAAVVIPFILLVSVSLSSESDISYFGYKLIPKTLDLSAYRYIFKHPTTILNAYKVTFIFSVISLVLSTVMASLFAYPLSRKNFKPRNKLSMFIYFTTMFSGGLVPSYILITQYLHLDNTIWVYIIPSMFGVWNTFVMRTFFSGLPDAIIDSAYIDGAGEYRMLFQIVYPLSTPVLATMAVGTFLGKWNDWYTAMLYIDKTELYSLQYMLQRIMQNLTLLQTNEQAALHSDAVEVPAETVRMAMAVTVAGPILFVFPFFQKYFVKGMVLGSVKG